MTVLAVRMACESDLLRPMLSIWSPIFSCSCLTCGVGRSARVLVRTGNTLLLTTTTDSPGVRPIHPAALQTSIASSSVVTLKEPSGLYAALKPEPRIPIVAVEVLTL